jgi:hypothetical protein
MSDFVGESELKVWWDQIDALKTENEALRKQHSQMVWTPEKPTVPGWYWWKRICREKQIVRLILSPAGHPNIEVIGTDQYAPGYYDDGLWAGPIPPPARTETEREA